MQQLSWKEKYAGILVLLTGIIFLLMQIASLVSNTSHPYSFENGALVVDKNELFSDVRTYSIILAGLLAGWLLLKGKRFGWILGLPILLFIATVVGVKTAEELLKVKKVNNAMITPGIIIFLFLLAVLFLCLPAARKKYRVSKSIVLLTLLLYAALTMAYILLQ